ncbi:NAD(P)-dependent oxidoreductase [Rhodopseudomonas sp. P2A-2r]|uniref:NAD-dependent epimerase/dehydratase family protein n=1 Tax=Rhodopseudomonas sp. P2A-2r TaxID=2991972 RepID=UPI00223420A2|nr:NAD(P)-dependent oxidoreductase [Rhodopseudomonas sp. P2A-2r]UZE49719.1 NAD(P)-dependent oxidoreductase [Rhodopseudomonas sp. P2A-2r]
MQHASATIPGDHRGQHAWHRQPARPRRIDARHPARHRAQFGRGLRFPAAGAVRISGRRPVAPAPAALYGISKLAAEQAALRIAQLRGTDVRVVRLGPVFGPWELPSRVRDALSPHHQIIKMARDGVEVVLPRIMAGDWIYSRDAADGIARVSRSAGLRHELYNLGGGVMTDLPQWCAIVAGCFEGFRWRMADEDVGNIVYGLPKDRAALSIARLQQDTGFAPSRDLAAAARDYLDWIAAGDAQ